MLKELRMEENLLALECFDIANARQSDPNRWQFVWHPDLFRRQANNSALRGIWLYAVHYSVAAMDCLHCNFKSIIQYSYSSYRK